MLFVLYFRCVVFGFWFGGRRVLMVSAAVVGGYGGRVFGNLFDKSGFFVYFFGVLLVVDLVLKRLFVILVILRVGVFSGG